MIGKDIFTVMTISWSTKKQHLHLGLVITVLGPTLMASFFVPDEKVRLSSPGSLLGDAVLLELPSGSRVIAMPETAPAREVSSDVDLG